MNKRHIVKITNNDFVKEAKQFLSINLTSYQMYIVYDLSEPHNSIHFFDQTFGSNEKPNLLEKGYLAIEPLDGQFCMRNHATQEILTLHNLPIEVKTATLHCFDPISNNDYERLIKYTVNPVEKRIKNMGRIADFSHHKSDEVRNVTGFIELTDDEINQYYNDHSFSMTAADLKYVQTYFKSEKRDPTETELKVLDTYWSDHCRHTTFNTIIESLSFDEMPYKEAIEKSLALYLKEKKELAREKKPLTLMDIAVQAARVHQKLEGENLVEESDEVNACSIVVDIDVNGINEEWLLMFKNETHNHPTEIEPFGGAATCVGGAIRDPLSGRAYVYQAMRITGCGNVLETVDQTRADKLPQRYISRTARLGNASYGNQIGLTNTFTREIYHDSYKAKRMELGALVGAVKRENVLREAPLAGDLIVMLGGRTGRDGVGGATGSSVSHDAQSVQQSAAEVQKGNAHEERKIIRLFRRPEITKVIKKSNDFGAGGVSVAIGELAPGICVDLNKVPVKYPGMNATEIAISESQERMAVVIDPEHLELFMTACSEEGLEAIVVAAVTNEERLVLNYNGEAVVDISREFLDSSGVTQHTTAKITGNDKKSPYHKLHDNDEKSLEEILSRLEYGSQKGLIEAFDSTIGASTVVAPLSGKTLLTQNIASVQSFPVEGKSDSVSVLTHGFIPELSEYNPYLGAMMAVYESVLKTVAVGGTLAEMALSFQEYFNRLTNQNRWGNVVQALLGAYQAQRDLKLSAIGGKDSMSGSFEDLDVVDTLVSFACSKQDISRIITAELKRTDSWLYVLDTPYSGTETVDFSYALEGLNRYIKLVDNQKVLSSMTTENRSITMTLINMQLGNMIGADLIANDELLNTFRPGAIVFESSEELFDKCFIKIGQTSPDKCLCINGITSSLNPLREAFIKPLDDVFPSQKEELTECKHIGDTNDTFKGKCVYIPVFTGTVNEIDLEKKINEMDGTVLTNIMDSMRPAQAIKVFVDSISKSDLLILSGDYCASDEPLGNTSVIASWISFDEIHNAIDVFVKRGGLILGLDGGFNALLRTGYLPYGTYKPSLNGLISGLENVSTLRNVDIIQNDSIWFQSLKAGQSVILPLSHPYKDIQLSDQTIDFIKENLCIKSRTREGLLESMVSKNGQICGILGMDQRITSQTFKNQTINGRNLFENIAKHLKEIQHA